MTHFKKIFLWEESCVFLQSIWDQMFELEYNQFKGQISALAVILQKAHFFCSSHCFPPVCDSMDAQPGLRSSDRPLNLLGICPLSIYPYLIVFLEITFVRRVSELVALTYKEPFLYYTGTWWF